MFRNNNKNYYNVNYCKTTFRNNQKILIEVTEKFLTFPDNYWGPWSRSSSCSVSCGDGVQTRHRTCHTLPGDGGQACEGPAHEVKPCNWGQCGEGA